MKISILTGCQMEGLVSALQILLPDAEVDGFHTYRLMRPERDEIKYRLAEADLIFALPMEPQFDEFAEVNIRDLYTNVRFVPHVAFPAFHPDIVYITTGEAQTRVQSPLTDYNSNIAASAFLMGLDVERTIGLFNSYIYAALGYFDILPHARDEMLAEFARYDIDLTSALEGWLGRSDCFMYSQNHPRGYVMADVALEAARAAGFDVPAVFPCPDMMPDRLSESVMYPVFPEIAARLGKMGHTRFKALTAYKMDVMTLDHFVERSFRLYDLEDASQWMIPPRVAASKATLETLLA